MKRKELSPEEIEAREARRAQFREIAKQVAALTDSERATLTQEIGAVTSCLGHELSFCNTMLLMFQRPNVSQVGGFRQWLSVGRCVAKGERGLSIYIPKGKRSDGPESGDGEPTGSEVSGDGERARFIVGTVFDISQTVEASTKEDEGRAAA